jgi:hypothetical protein
MPETMGLSSVADNCECAMTVFPGVRWRNIAALVLLAIGSLQMIGYATGNRVLLGLGAATAMAPLPKVFSDVRGLEPFASTFTLHYQQANGVVHEIVVTPELYGRLKGPYNRRNAYGAALAYAPRLPTPLWTSIYCYGLSPDGPLRRELALRRDDKEFAITIRTLTRDRHDIWTFAPVCVP